jgi:hypothetical protein
VDAGSTNPAERLISINKKPANSKPRRGKTSSRNVRPEVPQPFRGGAFRLTRLHRAWARTDFVIVAITRVPRSRRIGGGRIAGESTRAYRRKRRADLTVPPSAEPNFGGNRGIGAVPR